MFPKILVILALCVLPAFSAPSPLVKVHKAKEPIAGRYIITLKEDASRQANVDSCRKTGGPSSITHEWDIINGFAGFFSMAEIEILRSNPDVLSIEEDGVMHSQATLTQQNAPWGLARISSQSKLVNQNAADLTFKYEYHSSAGSGTTVYIIDTGIFTSHPAFGNPSRASWGATFGTILFRGYPSQDGNGHGTHCAGIAVSGPYGVAKAARVVAVKVLSDAGPGTASDIISGIDWVASNHGGGPAVASLSLTGEATQALDDAITNLINSGVTTVVAAGNLNVDAINTSPARVGAAITVGASTIADTKAPFSNYGSVVDVWAPGTDIISTWIDSGKNTFSGTSAAAPHVAGFAAYLLGMDSSLTPSSVASTIKSKALSGVLTGIPPGTANLLLNNRP